LAEIRELYLKDFRLFRERRFSFGEGINVIYGGNGAGKTSLLESIYLLNYGKSFRAKRVEDIAFGKDFYVSAKISRVDGFFDIETEFNFKGMKKRINRKLVKFSDIVKTFFSVYVSSDRVFDFFKVKKERRRWIDFFSAGVDNLYINYLLNYNKSLRNKNEFLKKGKKDSDLFDVWTEQLRIFGAKIRERREVLVSDLNEILKERGVRIILQKRDLSFGYEEELKRKRVLSGPHLDNVLVNFAGRDVYIYGSKGIWKIVFFYILDAYINVFEKRRGEKPLLMLDDFDSDLDSGNLLKSINLFKTQTFLTFVSEGFRKSIKKYNLVEV